MITLEVLWLAIVEVAKSATWVPWPNVHQNSQSMREHGALHQRDSQGWLMKSTSADAGNWVVTAFSTRSLL